MQYKQVQKQQWISQGIITSKGASEIANLLELETHSATSIEG